jgi:hypothetical protein
VIKEITAVAFFCQDIREEVGGTNTLVGVMSDNTQVPRIPFALGRFGIYARALLPLTVEPHDLALIMRLPDGTDVKVGEYTEDFIRSAIEEARETGTPAVGIIATSTASPFPVLAEGVHRLLLKAGEEEKLIGMMNFTLISPPEGAAESET